VLAILVREGR